MRSRFSKHLARALGLIALGCALFIVAPANRVTPILLPVTPPAVSPTPEPTREVKRPNPVRRFFSSVINGITGVFRREDRDRVVCHLPPYADLTSSTSLVKLCPRLQHSLNPSCSSSTEVTLATSAMGLDDGLVRFRWAVTAGQLRGEGRSVTWNLAGLPVGTYTATMEMDDGHQHTVSTSTSVEVALCSDCVWTESPCPTVSVSCPSRVDSKQSITFEATVFFGFAPDLKPTYSWSLTAGKIISGQGTSKITVDASDVNPQSITATVSLGGTHPACSFNTASCTVEYGTGQR